MPAPTGSPHWPAPIGGVAVIGCWWWPVAATGFVGLLITVAILAVLRQVAREIYRRLMDAVDPALVGQAEQTLQATAGVLGTGQVRTRWIGHQIRAECEVIVDPGITAVQAHQVGRRPRSTRCCMLIPRLAWPRSCTPTRSPTAAPTRTMCWPTTGPPPSPRQGQPDLAVLGRGVLHCLGGVVFPVPAGLLDGQQRGELAVGGHQGGGGAVFDDASAR